MYHVRVKLYGALQHELQYYLEIPPNIASLPTTSIICLLLKNIVYSLSQHANTSSQVRHDIRKYMIISTSTSRITLWSQKVRLDDIKNYFIMSKMHNFRKFEHLPHCFILRQSITSSYTHTRKHLHSQSPALATPVLALTCTSIHMHSHSHCNHLHSHSNCIHIHIHSNSHALMSTPYTYTHVHSLAPTLTLHSHALALACTRTHLS